MLSSYCCYGIIVLLTLPSSRTLEYTSFYFNACVKLTDWPWFTFCLQMKVSELWVLDHDPHAILEKCASWSAEEERDKHYHPKAQDNTLLSEYTFLPWEESDPSEIGINMSRDDWTTWNSDRRQCKNLCCIHRATWYQLWLVTFL